MKISFSFLGIAAMMFGILACSTLNAKVTPPFDEQVYINPWLETTDPRYPTTEQTIDLLTQTQSNVLLQINVTSQQITPNKRPDFALACIFGHWAFLNNAKYYLTFADLTNADTIALAPAYLSPFSPAAKTFSNDIQQFLATFINQIDFLYLDTTDYQQEQPEKFQQTLLNMVKMVNPKLNVNNGIILIGNLPNKGKKCPALDYLKEQGWKITENNFQIILRHRPN